MNIKVEPVGGLMTGAGNLFHLKDIYYFKYEPIIILLTLKLIIDFGNISNRKRKRNEKLNKIKLKFKNLQKYVYKLVIVTWLN